MRFKRYHNGLDAGISLIKMETIFGYIIFSGSGFASGVMEGQFLILQR